MARKIDDSKRWRHVAGSLELFLGSYFAACGCLAILFFLSLENRDGVLLSCLGLLFGMLLIFRAGHLLAWRPWVFRAVALVLVLGPVIWVTPAFLAASTEVSAERHRSMLAASIQVRSIKAHDLPGVSTIQRFQPDLKHGAAAQLGGHWAVALRNDIQTVTAETFVWCLEKVQAVLHGERQPDKPRPSGS